MSGKRILIVDDEKQVAAALGRALQHPESGGHDVKICTQPQNVLEFLQRNQFDLVVTDLRMPGATGLDIIRRVKEVSPETRTVLITAFGSSEVQTETEDLAATYLTKPFTLQQFLLTVRKVLAEQAPEHPDDPSHRFMILDETRLTEIEKTLANLQVELGANLILLGDLTGRTIAESGSLDMFDLGTVTALLGSSMAASSELARTMGEAQSTDLHYHEGEKCDIYAAMINEEMILSLFFKRPTQASRIGIVWLYMRRAIDTLRTQLQNVMRDALDEDSLDAALVDALGTALDDALGI